MDVIVLRSLTTLFMFLVFIGIVVWAWKGRRRSDFDAAAQLPFADDLPAVAAGQRRAAPSGLSTPGGGGFSTPEAGRFIPQGEKNE